MTTHVGMLLYPGLTQLDLTGPFEVLHRVPGARVHLVWKDLEVVRADSGLGLAPTTTLADCPPLDVVFVPGGNGQLAVMQDPAVLGFLRDHGGRARYVTGVCTGSLILGAAGLLAARQQLHRLGRPHRPMPQQAAAKAHRDRRAVAHHRERRGQVEDRKSVV